MEIVFLGTAGAVPTKERSHSSVFIRYRNEGILVDCGEGTQRQLKFAGIRPGMITKILITHWHGDHTLGLPGLLESMGLTECENKVTIYGPKGTKEHFGWIEKAFTFEEKVNHDIVEVKKGIIFENNDYFIEALPLEHGITCYGYAIIEKDTRKMKPAALKKLGVPEGPLVGRLQEGKPITVKGNVVSPDDVSSVVKGRRIAIISDTLPCKNAVELATGADVVICEATYADDLAEKAQAYNHLTARQAAQIASSSGAKKLILTHFSQRYKSVHQIEDDARTVFDNTVCAKDFMKVVV